MGKKRSSGLDRREFLAAAGATAAAGGLLAGSAEAGLFRSKAPFRVPVRKPRPAKIALVFAHVPRGRPTWPTKDYDYDARRDELTQKLRAACPEAEFVVCVAHNRGDAERIIAANSDVDGFLVYLIGIWTGVPATIMRSGKPTVIVDDLFAGSGEILGLNQAIRRDKLRAALIGSSDFNDVVRGVKWLETIAAMKGAKIINVKNRDISGQIKALKDVFGTAMIQMKSGELRRRYDSVDEKEAKRWADYWIKGAERVVEPTYKDIVKSAKIHLAFCRALEEYQADAVTMDCLGFVYGGLIDAYPCLSFFELLNEGSTGVCESDVDSTSTFLMMRYLTGRPGYVSDPVIDTGRGEVIYAHCVGTNRVFGPKGKRNKYIIRSHAEDGKGASVQSLMPLDQPVTSLKVCLGDRHLVVHSGRTTRNVEEEKACRTKVAAKTEADRLLHNWTHGWHRVTFFGDWRNDVINLGRLLGLTVIEEDRRMA